jgi:excinuclease ABC subunit C
MATRGPIIVGMMESVKSIEHIETDSVLEALILEAHLIKKHQPVYNTKEKSNKSFNYVVITKEDFPRVITMRARELETKPNEVRYSFGPFPQGSVLREALTIVRKIFPFRDKCSPARVSQGKIEAGKPCFYAQLGLCPGVCDGSISKTEYTKTIQRIKLFFEGKKPALLRSLERDMKKSAKELKFEQASRLKKTIFALTHIQDVALLKAPRASLGGNELYRIEAYDVAHISGTSVVGVMVVLEDGEVKKSDYRKFKIKTSTNDDNASLREVLSRRLNHPEWPMPKLIVVDGGKAQVNTAEKILAESGIKIPVVGVVKDEHHRAREIIGDRTSRTTHERHILLANSEAHRFAIAYHRTIRGKL